MGSMYRMLTALSPVLQYFNGSDAELQHKGTKKQENPKSPLKTQLEELTKVMEESGIDYWVDSGTLLGLVREGDFIEWDKDIDLSIWREDLPKLRALWNRFKELGYDPWPHCTGPPYVFSLVPKHKNGKISVNIGGYQKNGDQTYRLVWDVQENRFPRENARYWLHEFYRFPLHASVFVMRSRFGARPLVGRWPWTEIMDPGYWEVPYHYLEQTEVHPSGYRIPAKAEEYLELRYGDWRTPVKDWDYKRDDGAYRPGIPACV